MNKEQIKDLLVEYAANTYVDFELFGDAEEPVKYLFTEFIREWKELPCDPEGFNPEQDKTADELIERYAADIIASAK